MQAEHRISWQDRICIQRVLLEFYRRQSPRCPWRIQPFQKLFFGLYHLDLQADHLFFYELSQVYYQV
ncbi:hypothetical protein AR158_c451L [Paramecium bursaria Chlorella virus AR158]|uniref:hypothetical protein n=1 Tax=Paramecium bursaria Chlorella virus AR158 TaxID=380598 RepID=UPI00015AA6E5|nr:hypothetical protein AR158_c451L [Paramecium bursaria Chlorella virus AR158]ABU43996.1 hypothetical protein AR158_c451L [Paramecium bursaria Chlorella virus AR158]